MKGVLFMGSVIAWMVAEGRGRPDFDLFDRSEKNNFQGKEAVDSIVVELIITLEKT